jgi:hypothetical protein
MLRNETRSIPLKYPCPGIDSSGQKGENVTAEFRRCFMRRNITICLTIAVLLSLSGRLYAADMYVQSLKAKIMSGPSFKSEVLGEAGKGTKLAASGKEGSWIKITFKNKQGYASSMLLSPRPPMERMSLIKGEESDIKQSVRRRASTYTSAAAARGLTQDDRKRLSRDEKSDYGGLDKMESFTVSAEEVSRFMEGNKL